MNAKRIFVFLGVLFISFIVACGPTTISQQGATPTPCATIGAVANTAATPQPAPTQLSGATTPITPLPVQPTFSPAQQATQMAQMQQANPGAPTTPPGAPHQTPLPPCATPTPTK